MYVLYHFPYSQHARRVVSLLEEARLSYELRHVAMGEGEHRSERYLAINPNHQVPTLLDGDLKIFESNAILRYLCHKHSLAQWYPQAPRERAYVDQWLDWNQCRLSPAVVDVVLNAVFLGSRGDQQAIDRGRSMLNEVMPLLAGALEKQPFVAGLQPTIADLSLASSIYQLSLASITPAEPSTRRWLERIHQIDGFRKSLPPPPG
jgi:glutathione S-transferase